MMIPLKDILFDSFVFHLTGCMISLSKVSVLVSVDPAKFRLLMGHLTPYFQFSARARI